MTAIVLPDLDRSTVEELRKKIPNLSEIELPSMREVGRTADDTIDRLLGRSKAPVWPWIAAGVGLVAVVGALAAYFAWFRRPTWDSEGDTWTSDTLAPSTTPTAGTDELADQPTAGTTGLTAAESSLASDPYRSEEV